MLLYWFYALGHMYLGRRVAFGPKIEYWKDERGNHTAQEGNDLWFEWELLLIKPVGTKSYVDIFW
jgi:hypothetical protein